MVCARRIRYAAGRMWGERSAKGPSIQSDIIVPSRAHEVFQHPMSRSCVLRYLRRLTARLLQSPTRLGPSSPIGQPPSGPDAAVSRPCDPADDKALPILRTVHRRICLTAIPSEIGAAPLEFGMRVGGGCGTRELREDDGSMGRFDSEYTVSNASTWSPDGAA